VSRKKSGNFRGFEGMRLRPKEQLKEEDMSKPIDDILSA
jgi:hypothetical protein